MSNSVKIAGALGVLLLAGVIFYLRSGNVNDITSRTDYNTQLKCRACGNEFGAKLDVGESAPFKCPKCGQMQAWHLWQCRKCQTTFLPPLEGNPPRPPMMPKCPKCGSETTERL